MEWISSGLGLGAEPKNLTLLNISLRAIIVFASALVMVRFADRRFLAKMSAVDAILGFILASMLARAVNGSAPLFPTIGGGFVLVLLHKACVKLAFHSNRFDSLIKGSERILIRDGSLDRAAMADHHINDRDLCEELRQEGKVFAPEEVKRAVIERSGKVSVIPLEKS